MHLFVSEDGSIVTREPGSTTTNSVTLPSDIVLSPTSTYTDWVLMQGNDRLIMAGRWNAPLVWIPSRQLLWRAGIAAPTAAPTLAAGAGTGLTGVMIGVYTFAEIAGDEIIHESNPSPASGSVSLTNQNRAWSSLPTSHTNPRVTHKRLYVSVDGDSYLFVANVPLTNASYTENVATNELGDEVSERRGVPPEDAIYVTKYHRRVWYTNGTDSFWFSELDEPESVHATNELKTQSAAFITMLRGMKDQLAVGCRRAFEDVQGWSTDDFAQRTISQDIGCISNRGSKVVNDTLWFPSQEGYMTFRGGSPQFVMHKLATYFRTRYEAAPSVYEGLQCAIDRRRHTLNILVPGDSGTGRAPLYYVAHYLPCQTELGGTGELPFWTFDTRATGRYDSAIGELTEGDLLDRLYSGACDGFVRKEGIDGNDDDTTTYYADVKLKHFFMGDPSGDDDHAHMFDGITYHAKIENNTWSPSGYVGDDDAASSATPQWNPPSVAGSLQTKNGSTSTAKSSHYFKVERAGKGLTPRLRLANPNGFEFRGVSIDFSNEGVNPPRSAI